MITLIYASITRPKPGRRRVKKVKKKKVGGGGGGGRGGGGGGGGMHFIAPSIIKLTTRHFTKNKNQNKFDLMYYLHYR